MTQHLAFSLPYRALFAHGMSADSLPSLVDALVVLLVRLHLADFYWGDVSLSNVLFRRSAGGFAAYLVDAETGELRPALSFKNGNVHKCQMGSTPLDGHIFFSRVVLASGKIRTDSPSPNLR